jgi:hypothetical protein
MNEPGEEEVLIDKLIQAMERMTGAVEHVGDMIEELNTNIGTLIDLEIRKNGE